MSSFFSENSTETRSSSVDTIRLFLLDDHQLMIESIESRLNQEPDLKVVGTATSVEEALPLLAETVPDVLILDLDLRGRGPFSLCEEIAERQLPIKVCFLTGHLANIFIDQALKLNAAGYLLKGEPLDVLIDGVHLIHRGEKCFSTAVEQRISFNHSTKKYYIDTPHDLEKLTTRQLEVLRHLARGKSVKEVAKDLHLSTKSVDSHKYRIMHKLGIHDRVELARFAIREGLLLP